MKRKNFTLVELLVVIAVIGILAGLIFPVAGAISEKGKQSKAQAQVNGIKVAVLVFEQDYSKLPSATDTLGIRSGKCYQKNAQPEAAYLQFFDILTYTDHDGATNAPTNATKSANPKSKRYLDPTSTYFTAPYSMRDPWGRPYIILLDTDYDGQIGDDNMLPGGTIFQKVAVISVGAKDGELSKSAIKEEIKNKNAVVSWE